MRHATEIKSYIDLLSSEMLNLIFVGLEHDLIAHVTFSKLRPYIYDRLYKGRGCELWRPILRASGLSTPNDGEIDLIFPHEWEALATEVVEHADKCHHPECSMNRLAENEAAMERNVNAGVGLMDTAVGKQNRRATGFDEMEVNPLWSGIAFKKKKDRYGFFVRDTWRTAAFVRDDRQDHNPKELRTLRYGDPLINHPIIWRSFATFPPVDRLSTLGSTTIEPENPDGVIVADVLESTYVRQFTVAVNSHRFRDMPNRSFKSLMGDIKSEQLNKAIPVIPKGWSLDDTLTALDSFIDWFRLVRWKLILDETPDETVYLIQALPEDYRDFLNLITY
ncbi:hypothetical protein BC629DRAFT_1539558 [Irpex lacteus]|nr:hypothetical protein BC629DRAFT_1539558 [Irpex lacteus]